MRTIYTDGSCLGNPGPGGRACILQGDGAEGEIVLSGGEQVTTNNVMELTAAIKALQCLWEKYANKAWKRSQDDVQEGFFGSSEERVVMRFDAEITITTDSNYVKLGITERMVTWKRRQWRRAKGGKLVENVALWKQLDALTACFPLLTWQRTKAHVGTELNERVDHVARQQAELQ